MSYSFKGMKEVCLQLPNFKSLQVSEEYLKAAPSSDQPNWPGCEGWRRRREGRLFPNPAFHGKKKRKEKKGEKKRERGRAAVFPLAWQQSSNIFFSSHHKYVSSFLTFANTYFKKQQFVKELFITRDELDHCTSSNFYYMRVKSTDATQTAALSFLSPWKWVYIN